MPGEHRYIVTTKKISSDNIYKLSFECSLLIFEYIYIFLGVIGLQYMIFNYHPFEQDGRRVSNQLSTFQVLSASSIKTWTFK